MKVLTFVIINLQFWTISMLGGVIRDDVNINKYTTLANQSRFDCVGEIIRDNEVVGSCVLIGEKYVVSTAHVFIEHDFKSDTMQISGQTIIAIVPYNDHVGNIYNYTFRFKGKKYDAEKMLIHPLYLDSVPNRSCDLVLITLKSQAKGITLPLLCNTFDELHSTYIGVGFGKPAFATKNQIIPNKSLKIAGENVVDSITGFEIDGNKSVLMSDFDCPWTNNCNSMGDSIPKNLEYLCSGGDSGGGIFRTSNKQLVLIGLTSLTNFDIQLQAKSGYYGQTMGFLRISTFNKWILNNMK